MIRLEHIPCCAGICWWGVILQRHFNVQQSPSALLLSHVKKVTLLWLFPFSSCERDLVLWGDYSKPASMWLLHRFVSVEVECLGKVFPKSGLHGSCLASLLKCRVPDHPRASELLWEFLGIGTCNIFPANSRVLGSRTIVRNTWLDTQRSDFRVHVLPIILASFWNLC